jgi:hypothetical protein
MRMMQRGGTWMKRAAKQLPPTAAASNYSQGGYGVLRVDDRREGTAPTFYM